MFFCVVLACSLSSCAPTPSTYAGDKVETRDCRWCNGSGVESGSYEGEPPPGVKVGGACVGCKGAKKLKVILPGPKHPAWLKGAVRDAEKARDLPVEVELSERQSPGRPVLGAVAGARLTFQGTGKPLEVSSAPNGKFRVLLEPGTYQVRCKADGYSEYQGQVSVAARQAPIWQEHARLVTPEQEADTSVADILLTR